MEKGKAIPQRILALWHMVLICCGMRTTSAEIISEGKRSSKPRADWWILGAFCCQGSARLGGVERDKFVRKSYTCFWQKPMGFWETYGFRVHPWSIPNWWNWRASAEHFNLQRLLMLTKWGIFWISRSYELFEIQIKTLSLIFYSYVIKLLCF